VINFTRAGRIGALTLAALLTAAGCSGSSTTPPATTPAGAATTPPAASTGTPAASASSGAINCVSGSITAAGSTALQPLVQAAAQQYTAACPGATINVQGGGSGTGLSQVSQGAVDIGDSDVLAAAKLATPDANALTDHQVAKQGWIMVVNPDVTGITGLTSQQAQDIWTCPTGQTAPKDANWSAIPGGPNVPIVLIIRPSSSGTRATFKSIVLGGTSECAGTALTSDSNGDVTTAVEQTPGSTSVIGFAYYNDPAAKGKVTGLQLDGVDATVANMQNGSYKLAAVGHMYTKGDPTGLTAAFLAYMMSPAVQQTLIPSLFYAPVGS
jgi:phosphate transport system substrate-binding protein